MPIPSTEYENQDHPFGVIFRALLGIRSVLGDGCLHFGNLRYHKLRKKLKAVLKEGLIAVRCFRLQLYSFTAF
jgi:hypothetical protein